MTKFVGSHLLAIHFTMLVDLVNQSIEIIHCFLDPSFYCRYDPRKRITAAQALDHE